MLPDRWQRQESNPPVTTEQGLSTISSGTFLSTGCLSLTCTHCPFTQLLHHAIHCCLWTASLHVNYSHYHWYQEIKSITWWSHLPAAVTGGKGYAVGKVVGGIFEMAIYLYQHQRACSIQSRGHPIPNPFSHSPEQANGKPPKACMLIRELL